MKPIVVIGGGLAGGAVATSLSRAGQAVTLLEREQGPHEKVCGEFLSVEACRDLELLGLAPESLGAVPIDRVRLHRGNRTIEAPLPFVARGISRQVLDEALLGLAASAGVQIVRGVRATGLRGTSVFTAQGEHEAQHVMLATGKHDLRGAARAAPATRSGYVGFKMHWRLPDAALREIGSAVELVLLPGGYAGLQRVGAREANLCLVVKRSRLAQLGGDWPALLSHLLREPILARRLAEAETSFARPLAIANLPYGFLHRQRPGDDRRIWRLGDQAAMTASLTGDGMAIALRSARLAAECMLQGGDPAGFHRALTSEVGGQVRRAMALQRLSEHPLALAAGTWLARFCPALLSQAASATRLPERGRGNFRRLREN